jgi:ankyrin repeat protein
VRALLEAGAELNHANGYGRTALIAAAQRGHVEVVMALLKA